MRIASHGNTPKVLINWPISNRQGVALRFRTQEPLEHSALYASRHQDDQEHTKSARSAPSGDRAARLNGRHGSGSGGGGYLRRHGEAFRQAHAGHLGRVERRIMAPSQRAGRRCSGATSSSAMIVVRPASLTTLVATAIALSARDWRAQWLASRAAECAVHAPQKPRAVKRRQSSAPFRQPDAHAMASAHRELCRVAEDIVAFARITWRTSFLLWPV